MLKIFFSVILLTIVHPVVLIAQQKNNPYKATNNYIQYTGRFEVINDSQLKTSAPGAYISFKFEGTDCILKISDENKDGKNYNYLQVVLDDSISYRLKLNCKENEIVLAKKLSPGPHKITVVKDTEAGIGFIIFKEIITEKLLPPAPKPLRKIEFMGNSITAGMGNDEHAMPCKAGEWYDQHNAWQAYGPLTARALNAQWHLTAISGIGLVSSCCGYPYIMPQLFDKINLQPDGAGWDFRSYQPEVLTICLGQNDGIQDSIRFVSAYIQFIQKLRSYYPKTEIILLSSPMANEALRNMLINYCTATKDALHKKGDKMIDTYFFHKQYAAGCDGHPDERQHLEIAGLLTNFIKTKMNW